MAHADDGAYEFYGKIKALQKEFADRFIKCHKSILVNKSKIIGVDKQRKEIILYNGYQCAYSLKHFNPNSIVDKN